MPGFFSAVALFIKELLLLVSYVKNNAFPQPLAEDEEDKHLRLMAQGNQHSRNLLIEHNLRLVAHIVNTMCTRNDVILGFMNKGKMELCERTSFVCVFAFFSANFLVLKNYMPQPNGRVAFKWRVLFSHVFGFWDTLFCTFRRSRYSKQVTC